MDVLRELDTAPPASLAADMLQWPTTALQQKSPAALRPPLKETSLKRLTGLPNGKQDQLLLVVINLIIYNSVITF